MVVMRLGGMKASVAVHTITGLSLCAGIGGLELGLKLAIPEYRTVGYVERDSYAATTLVARMGDSSLDPAPIWDDLESFNGGAWRGCVDIVSAGFPCQPFSTASRGRRIAFDLWPQVFATTNEVKPPIVFVENVQRAAIEKACRDLEDVGYTATRDRFDASEVGSPSPRLRWFALAHTNDARELRLPLNEKVARVSPISNMAGWQEDPGRFLGMDDGAAHRMDRLRCLGNAVVPQQAAHAFIGLTKKVGLT